MDKFLRFTEKSSTNFIHKVTLHNALNSAMIIYSVEKTKMKKERETNFKVNDKEKLGALILAELRAL